ncbi:Putative L,D-transpeptidase YciB precursor [Paenibacillus konkukensis]|uniref:L,D-transpeptidase YciB n=1 Tax=Paenibacillus konkukensis TaxID=2020716 RepID=A0ABY4RTW9_9BACL|nr:Putative L,D-transpeptidase YciB precursor [Paenibacillus konkukensis]
MKTAYVIASAGLMLLMLGGCGPSEPSSVSSAPTPPVAAVTDQAEQAANTASAIDWTEPSGGPYPALAKGETIWLDVSIGDQKVYVKDGDKVLYSMVMSSGLDTSPDNTSPQGTYYIEPERGDWFYSKKAKEGAMYWVSWKNHGEFLFHSVPMDEERHVIVDEADKLGQKASHGCFRLSIPDAKWIYDHVPKQTKVVVHS